MFFIGPDRLCETHDASCIVRKIPTRFRKHFAFKTQRISRDTLTYYKTLVRAAIFPSLFETFCISAHEIYFLGIPLLISDIPAFRDYFTNDNSVVFRSGSVTSLRKGMEKVLNWKGEDYAKAVKNMKPIEYSSPLVVYSPESLKTVEEPEDGDIYASQILNG